MHRKRGPTVCSNLEFSCKPILTFQKNAILQKHSLTPSGGPIDFKVNIRLKGVSPRKGHPNCSSEFRRIQLVVIGCYQHCFSKERSLTHILHQDVCLFHTTITEKINCTKARKQTSKMRIWGPSRQQWHTAV